MTEEEEDILKEISDFIEQDDLLQENRSTFDYQDHFSIPINPTLHEPVLKERLSLQSGISIIVATVIGGGIFISPGIVYEQTRSFGASILVWIISGLLAMTGAFCYAELGSMIPESGGEFAYLMRAFNSLPAFLFAWTGTLITRPGSIAIIVFTFSTYTCSILNLHGELYVKLASVLCIIALCILNSIYPIFATWAQDFLTILKLLSLGIISIAGLIYQFQTSHLPTDWFSGSSLNLGSYCIAIYSALWAYDGWNSLNLVTSELNNPKENLPKAVILGPLIIMLSYVFANISYFIVLPPEIVMKSEAIAVDWGKTIWGDYAGVIIPLVVVVSCLSAINASIFTGARVIFVSAKHNHIPKIFGEIHPKFKTPLNSLVLLSTEAIFFVIIGNIKSLINLYSLIALPFYLLTAIGLLVLRVREKDLSRPFKTWIIVPIIFCFISIFLIIFGALEAPMEAIASLFIFIIGTVYWFFRVRNERYEQHDDLFYRIKKWFSCFQVRKYGYSKQSNSSMELDEF